MKKLYDIFCVYDNDLVGIAEERPNGEWGITINGKFIGLYPSFQSWNLAAGNGYRITEHDPLNHEPLTEFEKQLNEYQQISIEETRERLKSLSA